MPTNKPLVLSEMESGIQPVLQTLLQKALEIIYLVLYETVSWCTSDSQGCIRWH